MVSIPASQVVLMIAAGLLAARVGRAFRIPEAIPLLIVGYMLGSDFLGFLRPQEIGINFEFLSLLAVPIILFYDGLKTEARQLGENIWSVVSMATVAVVVTVVGIAFFSNLFLRLSWPASFLLGAILASTDPASIVPVLRKLNIKKRISTVLEAEAALNDATAITVFGIVLAIATAGQNVGLKEGLSQFIYYVASSGILGAAVGFTFYEAFARLKVESDLVFASFVVLLTAYGLADFFHTSTVLTIVVSALIFRSFVQSPSVNASTRLHTLGVWEDINFITTSVVFLVLGAQIQARQAGPFLAVGVLIALAFMFVVRPATVLLSLFFDKSFSLREKVVISWLGGPRGVVSAALAGIVLGSAAQGQFSPQEATVIFNITMIVIGATVAITSLTASGVTKRLLRIGENAIEDDYKRLSTELKTMMVAGRRFREEWKQGIVSTKIYDEIRRKMGDRMRKLEKQLEAISKKAPYLEDTETAAKAREIILTQISVLEEAYENKEIPEKEYLHLLGKLRAQADTLSEIANAKR